MFACIHTQGIPSLTEFAYGFSPVVEEVRQDTVVIDVEGCELLFGSPYQLASEVVQRAQTTVNVAVAANPDAAIHAATHLKGITFVSPGEELTCLGDFPLDHLDYSLINVEKKIADQILETLRLWGIRTFADFAALPQKQSLDECVRAQHAARFEALFEIEIFLVPGHDARHEIELLQRRERADESDFGAAQHRPPAVGVCQIVSVSCVSRSVRWTPDDPVIEMALAQLPSP